MDPSKNIDHCAIRELFEELEGLCKLYLTLTQSDASTITIIEDSAGMTAALMALVFHKEITA